MLRLTYIAAACLLAALAITACGGSDSESDPTQAAATSTSDDGTPQAESTPSPGDGTETASAQQGSIELGECEVQVPPQVQIECGHLEVPADRDDPDGGTVRLAFGVIRSPAEDPAEDPLVYLAGGPGQVALEAIAPAYGEVYAPLVGNRDLVILDQRGVGLSEPALACDEYTTLALESLGSELAADEQAQQAAEALETCRQRLSEQRIDFSAYNSAASAADLEALRMALGYEEWNLYGVSYGTRLALTTMRDYPEGIRSVVLDASYPLDVNLYTAAPDNLSRAIDGLVAACEANEQCSQAFPDLGQSIFGVVQALNEQPAPITVINQTTGEPVETEITGDGFVGFLFQAMYATGLLEYLPELIGQAQDGNLDTVGLLTSALSSQVRLLDIGMQIAVQCQEEVPFEDVSALEEAAAEHELTQGFFEDSPTIGSRLFSICERWAAGEPAPDANQAVDSEVPALVFAGELDPITPPAWGEDVVADLPNSFFYEFPFTGHGSVPSHACAAGMMMQFLETPAEAPDAGCIEGVASPEFTPGSIEIEMVPYQNQAMGYESLAPESWTEVQAGVHQDGLLVALIQQIVPNLTREQFLEQVAAQPGQGATPEPVDSLDTAFASWQIYESDQLGQQVYLGIAEHENGLLLVQVTTTPSRADVHRDEVFRPALEAFNPAP